MKQQTFDLTINFALIGYVLCIAAFLPVINITAVAITVWVLYILGNLALAAQIWATSGFPTLWYFIKLSFWNK